MKSIEIGIIGGSGLGQSLIESGGEPTRVSTPFGYPSCNPIVTTWGKKSVAFIARHGHNHLLNPSEVPYRANIWALKKLGAHTIFASGATGSLREEIEPKHLVICDQVIDKTYRRDSTFFDKGIAAHIEFADPFCPHLRNLLVSLKQEISTKVHISGTYVCMEGPQFSTRAESEMHRSWGGELIGMTCMPEAKLAREAGVCYALIALPTDYDCWRPQQEHLLTEILGNLKSASDNAERLLRLAVENYEQKTFNDCNCHSSLELAIWSPRDKIDKERLSTLDLLL